MAAAPEIVTLEGLIEEIVGDIDDEFDTPRLGSARDTSGEDGHRDELLLDGLLHRDEVRDRTGFELPDGGFSTLGGYVQESLGRVPNVGDEVRLHDALLVVAEMDGHRVATVRFERASSI